MPALLGKVTEKSTDAKKGYCDGPWEYYYFKTEFDSYQKDAGLENRCHLGCRERKEERRLNQNDSRIDFMVPPQLCCVTRQIEYF